MVYSTLQMHYSPILKSNNIYNHTPMDALYMYVYVHFLAYMCIYTGIICVKNWCMHKEYINVFIYLYISAVLFYVCGREEEGVRMCEDEDVLQR